MEGATPDELAADAADNHFVDVTSWGSETPGINFTTGPAMLLNDGSLNRFRPLSNSPLIGRMLDPVVGFDSMNDAHDDPGTIGAFSR